jgi:hypothetical protein
MMSWENFAESSTNMMSWENFAESSTNMIHGRDPSQALRTVGGQERATIRG